MRLVCLMCAAMAIGAVGSQPDSEADRVESVARAYAEGVLDGDAVRVQRASHPLLAKRRVDHEYWGEASRAWLRSVTHEQLPAMIDYLHESGAVSPASTKLEVEVLDIVGSCASAKIRSDVGVQLVHLVRLGGEWLVAHDAYELADAKGDGGSDSKIRAKVADYARGFYARDASKTLGSCHTSLAKHSVVRSPDGVEMLDPMSHEELGLLAQAYNAYWKFDARGSKREISVLATEGTIAAVRLDAENWTELMHLAKLDDEWLIIDVLTVDRP